MSELKNSDGIPIRVGQVWEDREMIYRVVGFDDDEIITRDDNHEFDAWPYTGYCFTHLISDPVFGDMSDWRMVTEQEKRDHPFKPLSAEFWLDGAGGGWWSKVMDCKEWTKGRIYRVPRDFEWPRDDQTWTDRQAADEFKGVGIEEHGCGGPQESCMQAGCEECGTPRPIEQLSRMDPIATPEMFQRDAYDKINEIIAAVNAKRGVE